MDVCRISWNICLITSVYFYIIQETFSWQSPQVLMKLSSLQTSQASIWPWDSVNFELNMHKIWPSPRSLLTRIHTQSVWPLSSSSLLLQPPLNLLFTPSPPLRPSTYPFLRVNHEKKKKNPSMILMSLCQHTWEFLPSSTQMNSISRTQLLAIFQS